MRRPVGVKWVLVGFYLSLVFPQARHSLLGQMTKSSHTSFFFSHPATGAPLSRSRPTKVTNVTEVGPKSQFAVMTKFSIGQSDWPHGMLVRVPLPAI